MATLYRQVKILNQLFLRRVGEADLLQIHTALCAAQYRCVLPVLYHGFLINQLKHPGSGRQGILQLCHHP